MEPMETNVWESVEIAWMTRHVITWLASVPMVAMMAGVGTSVKTVRDLCNKQILFHTALHLIIGLTIAIVYRHTHYHRWLFAKASKSNDGNVSYVKDVINFIED